MEHHDCGGWDSDFQDDLRDKERPAELPGRGHRWELPGNYPVFTVVMVIYHYVERIWIIPVTPIF